ncbi:hypothetical protein ACWGSK_23915 [Nocardiopsis sp. NPDC055551]
MPDEPHRPTTITVEQGAERLRFTTTPTPDGRVSIEAVGFTDDGEITTNLSGVLPAEIMATLGWLMLQSSATGQAPAGFVREQRRHHPNAYRPWSTEDDELLARHAAQGTTLATLAEEFGRNTGAIRARLTRLGINDLEPG